MLFGQDALLWHRKFEPIDQELPTPNIYRSADGSPGPSYWQQKADYDIQVQLIEPENKVEGSGTITYHNNSPHTLKYVWLQLDQNRRAPDNPEKLTSTLNLRDTVSAWAFNYYNKERTTENGMHITSLKNSKGKKLSYIINQTMMKVNLPTPLQPNETIELKLAWWYNLNNRMEDRGRSGYEYFPGDDNNVYTIAQFYPRMAVYDDVEGWQHKQFLGTGEFALPFGDYKVEITVPMDHLLMATGELTNAKEVLSQKHYKGYQKAFRSFKKPVIIADQEEAEKRETIRSPKVKTWKFEATNVRDFAFASSRKFIWDAQAVKLGDKTILAQSLYPKEGNPLWEEESTKAVVNTLKTYSKYSVNYPYPHATSIHAAAIGMEYPMICFNFGRPAEDGTYTDRTKYGMIGVIIHEVGHNFFPMIVNSDERQWAWMDEGINTYLEYVTSQECYENFPKSSGSPDKIVGYMSGNQEYMRPIMTSADQIISWNLGNNAYSKPATALNILRETILGRELFDQAFKSYSEKWAFKHPKPADFFRSIEDAAGMDLDWFWKGWFYTTDPVDLSIDTVVYYQLDPNIVKVDKTNSFDDPKRLTISETPEGHYWEFKERMDEDLMKKNLSKKHIYKVKFSNPGGLIMPLILKFGYKSGKEKMVKIPAEVWRKNEEKITKMFILDEPVEFIQLDPELETADINTSNNRLPRLIEKTRFEKFKDKS